jgi:hypothetical protein
VFAVLSTAAHHHKHVVGYLPILVLIQPASTSPEPCRQTTKVNTATALNMRCLQPAAEQPCACAASAFRMI